jgi:multiple sugar transport system permease protein
VLLLPAGIAVYHAFTDWQPGYASPWVGLRNFTDLASSPNFQQILKNQAILLLGLPLWTIAPLVLAVMLHERMPAPGLFRTVFFFPATVSPAIIGILFSFLLAPNGPLNSAIKSVGLDSAARNWLVDPLWVKPTLIAVFAWATIGVGVVIFAAGLSTVPPELFEAAELDGASWWQRFYYVALPSVASVVRLWAVILVISVFVGLFPWIFTLTRGGPGYGSTTLDYDIYQQSLNFGYFGLGAAETVYLLAIVGAILAVGGGVFRRGAEA